MENNKMLTKKTTENGYKIVEVNMSDSAESLYAVCTPIKMQ
ncbi:hypothetical protein [Oceanobacillus bengalensis]|nr:hypothetical protein [Oceanobacillus bengalensis]